jgi:hypothetical protein
VSRNGYPFGGRALSGRDGKYLAGISSSCLTKPKLLPKLKRVIGSLMD